MTTSLKRGTRIKEGDFISLSEPKATRFADRASKLGYYVHVRPRFGKAGWEISVRTGTLSNKRRKRR